MGLDSTLELLPLLGLLMNLSSVLPCSISHTLYRVFYCHTEKVKNNLKKKKKK